MQKKPRYRATPKPRKKPGPKPKRSPILGRYNVPPEKQCGFIKKDGKACKAPKLLVGGIEMQETTHCYRHTPRESLPALEWTFFEPPKTLGDLKALLADVMLRIRNEELDPKIGGSIAGVARELLKTMTVEKKLDPREIATRAFSREAAAKLANQLTIEQAREILQSRSTLHIREQIEEQELKQLENITDITGEEEDA